MLTQVTRQPSQETQGTREAEENRPLKDDYTEQPVARAKDPHTASIIPMAGNSFKSHSQMVVMPVPNQPQDNSQVPVMTVQPVVGTHHSVSSAQGGQGLLNACSSLSRCEDTSRYETAYTIMSDINQIISH